MPQNVNLAVNGDVRAKSVPGVNARKVTEFSYAAQTERSGTLALRVHKLGETSRARHSELNIRPVLNPLTLKLV
jgi:hypothetical protein